MFDRNHFIPIDAPHRRRPRHLGRSDVIILHHRDRRRVSTVVYPRVGRIWQECVIHATPSDASYDQRPSRSQVAANAPSSSSKPIRPANNGSTPTPLTTLASRIFTPIQPSPRNTLDARTGTIRGRSMLEPSTMRLASPPVACVSGLSISVVEVTSENSLGLVGPTLISAFNVPSLACQRPSSLAGMVERQVPGSPALSVNSRVAPLGEVTVTGETLSAIVWRITASSCPCTCRRNASSSR